MGLRRNGNARLIARKAYYHRFVHTLCAGTQIDTAGAPSAQWRNHETTEDTP
jgi:hypothetical protein